MSELPEGFVLDQAGHTDLPPGFELDAQHQAAAEPRKFGIMDTWPVRLAKGVYNAVKLPGDVYAGKVDPLSQEGIERAADLASVASPINPAVRAGDMAIAGVTRRGPKSTELPANVKAAQTAVDIEGPLPAGIASPSPVTRALTQGARQLPGVGPKIDTAVANTVEKAGEHVNELASHLTGGITDRASAGSIIRPSLEGVIEQNNAHIDEAFKDLRGMINPDAKVSLPRTTATVNAIVRERQAAGQKNPWAGLEDVKNLTNEGTSFNGIQRARSDIGNNINFGQANPGFNKGDLKRLYGSMSADMEHVASTAAGPGKAAQAVQALRDANATAATHIEQNKTLQRLVNMRAEEGLTGTLIRAASDKTGDVKLLAQLRGSMPKEDFQQIAGVALSELGHNPATNKFSLDRFMTGWNKMGDRAKAVLFEKGHRDRIDEIAKLGEWIKGGEQYMNTSKTGHAVGLAGVVGFLGHAAAEAATGNFKPLLGSLASLGGGYFFAKALAKPATASSIARWTRAAQAYERAPSAATRASITLATNDLLTNLVGLGDYSRAQLVQMLSPKAAEADGNQPPAKRGDRADAVRIPQQPNR